MRHELLGPLGLVAWAAASALVAEEHPAPVRTGEGGRLEYEVFDGGDRVPDFSHAGYGGGGEPIPQVPVRVVVEPVAGDDGARIQAALDRVASGAADEAGLRGAVLLAPGEFEVAGQLRLRAGGVVLRGSGAGPGGTLLVATGRGREPLIEVAGTVRRRATGEAVAILGDKVPVGGDTLELASTRGLAPGTRVEVLRPSPEAWLSHLGMDVAPARQPYRWKEGKFDLRWTRMVRSVRGRSVTLDAPLTTALEERWGGGTLQAVAEEGYLRKVGVEDLRCRSEFDRSNPHDEEHAWNAIDLHAVRDGWVSGVVGEHFVGSVVQVGAMTERVTVMDCHSRSPVSEPNAGYRRLAFHSRGQQTLFLRCTSEEGIHDFSVGYQTPGPVVFLECRATGSTGWSGSIGSGSSGLLFDRVSIDGGALRLDNLEIWNQGVGWAAANSAIWNSEAATIVCRQPPGAHNWAVGVWGQCVGDGRWSDSNRDVRPASLYRAQLAARRGDEALAALDKRPRQVSPVDAPRLEDGSEVPGAAPEPEGQPLALRDGVLHVGERRLSGRWTSGGWWLGRMEPARAAEAGPAITRFAPGRTGTGLTDELPALAEQMAADGIVAFRHHYGLWYDRRRIDHEMIRRPDADVWPPFFEQPFARSGKGRAWDGLSRYDLTQYNPWYFGRLREFAREARRHGLVLVNEMYFQHNILESGAHWVDSPWRPANNVNDTGFTEPPPFNGDTIKMADEFYDVDHPVRRGLHRAFIRQCLSNLAGETNVIHTLTAENSGPLHFMEFWLDVIAEWEKESGHAPLIALSAPKDVQDAILADPVRSKVVDVIDLSYWHRSRNGREFAPAGGQSLAPRQHQRRLGGGRPSREDVAAMAAEYRGRFPGKAVITGYDSAGDIQPGLDD